MKGPAPESEADRNALVDELQVRPSWLIGEACMSLPQEASPGPLDPGGRRQHGAGVSLACAHAGQGDGAPGKASQARACAGQGGGAPGKPTHVQGKGTRHLVKRHKPAHAQDKKTEHYKGIVEQAAEARPGVLALMDEALDHPDVAVCICSAATKEGFIKVGGRAGVWVRGCVDIKGGCVDVMWRYP